MNEPEAWEGAKKAVANVAYHRSGPMVDRWVSEDIMPGDTRIACGRHIADHPQLYGLAPREFQIINFKHKNFGITSRRAMKTIQAWRKQFNLHVQDDITPPANLPFLSRFLGGIDPQGRVR